MPTERQGLAPAVSGSRLRSKSLETEKREGHRYDRREIHTPSALSRLNFWVEALQFDSRFLDRELPIDSSLVVIDPG
jgi:hypothetical protein